MRQPPLSFFGEGPGVRMLGICFLDNQYLNITAVRVEKTTDRVMASDHCNNELIINF